MRNLFTKKTVKGLSAVEGYLELNLPQRAIAELDRIVEPGALMPYCQYLRGQALKMLDRYEEAIEVLQDAARTMPAPVKRKVWEDLSQCFRHQGLDELADVADLFADDPIGGADQDFSENDSESFLPDSASEFWTDETTDDVWNRSASFAADDFQVHNFDTDDYLGYDFDEEPKPSNQKPPQK